MGQIHQLLRGGWWLNVHHLSGLLGRVGDGIQIRRPINRRRQSINLLLTFVGVRGGIDILQPVRSEVRSPRGHSTILYRLFAGLGHYRFGFGCVRARVIVCVCMPVCRVFADLTSVTYQFVGSKEQTTEALGGPVDYGVRVPHRVIPPNSRQRQLCLPTCFLTYRSARAGTTEPRCPFTERIETSLVDHVGCYLATGTGQSHCPGVDRRIQRRLTPGPCVLIRLVSRIRYERFGASASRSSVPPSGVDCRSILLHQRPKIQVWVIL